jgi:hypothetical protein
MAFHDEAIATLFGWSAESVANMLDTYTAATDRQAQAGKENGAPFFLSQGRIDGGVE